MGNPVAAKAKQFGTLKDLSDKLTKANGAREVEAVRLEMVEFAKTALPLEYHANLQRFSVDMLAELLAYLMYGDGDDQPETGAQPEKN